MKNNDYNLTFLDESQIDNDHEINVNNKNIHESNEDHEHYIDNFQKPVDVRIIVDGAKDSEFLSKAIKDIDSNYGFNIVFSSIIPTKDVKIAKNAIQGADLVLIAVSADENKKKFFSFYDVLKNDLNYIESFNFPKTRDLEVIDIESVENEIKNSIINVGLSSILNFANINNLKNDLNKLDEKYEESLKDNEKLAIENDVIRSEAQGLKKENNKLLEEIKLLQNNIDEIKSEFTNFKSRFSNIYSKNLIETFQLSTLWEELFDEKLETEDKVIIATNKFKPSNIIVGQGLIGADSRDEAIEWLKIIRTALIFVNENLTELEHEFKDEKIKLFNFDKEFKDDDQFIVSNPKDNKESKNSDYDYDQFRNFWD